MNISRRIIELRESQNLSTNALSKKAGIAQSHLREIELGAKQPGIKVLHKICQGLGITLSDFFAEKDDIPLEVRRLIRAAEKLNPDQIELLTLFIESII